MKLNPLKPHVFWLYFVKNLDETSLSASNFYIVLLSYIDDIANDLEYMMADQITIGVLSTKKIKVGSQERGQQVRLVVRMWCVAFV